MMYISTYETFEKKCCLHGKAKGLERLPPPHPFLLLQSLIIPPCAFFSFFGMVSVGVLIIHQFHFQGEEKRSQIEAIDMIYLKINR